MGSRGELPAGAGCRPRETSASGTAREGLLPRGQGPGRSRYAWSLVWALTLPVAGDMEFPQKCLALTFTSAREPSSAMPAPTGSAFPHPSP